MAKFLALILWILMLSGAAKFCKYYFNNLQVLARGAARLKTPQWLRATGQGIAFIAMGAIVYDSFGWIIYFSGLSIQQSRSL
jgi:hypothetical protein